MRAHTTIALARPRGRENDRFYFRVGNNDHVVLNRLIAERRLQADGLVLDARRHERHKTLRRYAHTRVLDRPSASSAGASHRIMRRIFLLPLVNPEDGESVLLQQL